MASPVEEVEKISPPSPEEPSKPENLLQEEGAVELLPKEEFTQLVQDCLIMENYEKAERYLEDYKVRFGDGPDFIYCEGRLARAKGESVKYYQILKRLYYEFPVFMLDNREYETIRDALLFDKGEKARVHWNVLINLSSKYFGMEKKNMEESNLEASTMREKTDSELEKVIEAYKEILQIEPLHTTALKGLFQCYQERGDIEEANLFKTKVEKSERYWSDQLTKRSSACLAFSKKAVSIHQPDKAIQIVNLGLATSPNHRDLLLSKAGILRDIKRFREATGIVDQVLKKYPGEVSATRLRNEIQNDRLNEMLNSAQIKLKEAEQHLPGSDFQKLLREIQETLFEVLDADPENLRALTTLYQAQILAENPIKAKKTLTRIQEINPSIKIESEARRTGKAVNPYEEEEEPCFIATRLFGPESEEVALLRHFRERLLRPCFSGRLCIKLYSRVGPSLARLPGKSPFFGLVRTILSGLCRTQKQTR